MEHTQHEEHHETEHHETKKEHKKKAASPQKMLLIGAFVALLVLFFIAVAGIVFGVRKGSQNAFVVAGAQVFNVPVASINGMKVSYADYIEDVKALKKYNEKQGQSALEEEVSDRALSRLMVTRIIEKKANEEGIVVEQKDIDEATSALKSQFADEKALEEEMMSSFGWSVDTFIKRIVVPSLREQKLAEKFEAQQVNENDPFAIEQVKARHILFQVENEEEKTKVKAAAQKVLDRIKKGEDFEKLAKEFGSDGTKDNGGDLGWFGRGVMVPEFEEAAFALKAGELKQELVETQFGFHILKVDEKRMVRDFAAYVDEELSKANIKIHGNIHNPFENINK